LVLADGAVTLDLWFGDIKECLPKVPTPKQGIVDCWFLDGFAPSKNPEMWSQTLFNGMAMLAKQDCTCATFTAAGFVRRGLIEAGFEMKKVKGFGTKREMIAGSLVVKKSYDNIDELYPQVSASDSDDIAIIGGGIASATLAQCLAKRGKKVTLYCQDSKPAQGASGNRQGAVYPLINGEHQGVSRVFAPAFVFARQFVEQAADHLSFDHQWCGVTQLMWNEASSKKLTKMLDANLPPSILCHLNREQTSDAIGLPVDFESVYYPLGGWLCPAELTEQLLNRLEESGKLTAHYQHKVTALSFDASLKQWQVEIEAEHTKRFVSHSTLVIANGHAFQQLAPTEELHLTSVKGQVSHIPTSPALEKLKSVICYDGYLTPHNPKLGTHCIGASYDRQHIDTEYDPLAQCDNAEKIKNCIPNQKWVEDIDTSGELSRQGIRCVSRDHLPFVGPVADTQELQRMYEKGAQGQLPLHHNLYCFLGLGSRGLSSAPLLGELLASQICGDPLPLPIEPLKTLHPARTWAKRLKKGKPLGL
jgi:tRNA 5-methylaminomethyl-2-thiouridine biosynthesis bifunctional protein